MRPPPPPPFHIFRASMQFDMRVDVHTGHSQGGPRNILPIHTWLSRHTTAMPGCHTHYFCKYSGAWHNSEVYMPALVVMCKTWFHELYQKISPLQGGFCLYTCARNFPVCVCVCGCLCACVCVCMSLCVCLCVFVSPSMCVRVFVFACLWAYFSVCVCSYAYIYIYMCVCMCLCVWFSICICMCVFATLTGSTLHEKSMSTVNWLGTKALVPSCLRNASSTSEERGDRPLTRPFYFLGASSCIRVWWMCQRERRTPKSMDGWNTHSLPCHGTKRLNT